MKIFVVIPCFNVAHSVRNVVTNLPDFIKTIILVNDFSKDSTFDVLESIRKNNTKVIVINHPENKGVGGAMKTGFERAVELGAEIVVKIDGDGQMNPENIEALITPLIEGKAQYTKGNRFFDFIALRKMPVARRIGNLGLSFLIKGASGYWNIFDPTNGFIAIHTNTLKKIALNRIDDRFFFESSMLIELYYTNALVKDIPMEAIYNNEKSNLSLSHSFITFPSKLFFAFIRRIILKYFLYDFNVGSVYLIFGCILFFTGIVFGISDFYKYTSLKMAAPTGTVVIPTLLIILGFQLLLSALNYDIQNYPKQKNE